MLEFAHDSSSTRRGILKNDLFTCILVFICIVVKYLGIKSLLLLKHGIQDGPIQ